MNEIIHDEDQDGVQSEVRKDLLANNAGSCSSETETTLPPFENEIVPTVEKLPSVEKTTNLSVNTVPLSSDQKIDEEVGEASTGKLPQTGETILGSLVGISLALAGVVAHFFKKEN